MHLNPPLDVSFRSSPWTALCLAAALVGCGAPLDEGAELTGRSSAELVSTNGLSTNGLSTNGLSTNGLSTNGLSTNGLSTNGLSTNGFQTWFSQDPASADMVMRYVVQCSMAAGMTLTYQSPSTGKSYTWSGSLGLAPGWAGGQPATVAEQQVVSACLAAHANKYGVHVNISVLGRDAVGGAMPYSTDELNTYNEKEACFFGNLFTGEGTFAANDGAYLDYDESTVRTCGLSSWSDTTACTPMKHVGACRYYCTLDATRTYYTRCTYNGVSYRPITTRMLPQDIYRCGDGVCQLTEKCGASNTADSCAADCGPCK
ncbi:MULTISPECIES: hypothetical protein [unclassified Corallococcus]|uniref:hypothetical protein n=1 Tax=unclassified Corallococcus TaxID=2685029 RepID=UPI001A8F7ADB|nr:MULTISPECIES: hypothetical protein [unclassified Corallococcus]MBN9681941.1 hypothetical protein [Corallococcus sp. NCSPR001]WAS86493.1 hypothetical protein O0N60_05840 [Corallococcus sp. NCRR]